MCSLLGEWSAGVVNKLPTLISFSFLYFVVAALGFYSRSVALPFSSSSFQVRCCHVIVLLSSLCLCQFSTVEEKHCCHVTLDYTRHFPPLTVSVSFSFSRLSALSLRSMCPCPISDAEAHGKDGNSHPEQLYLSNGEVLLGLSLHCCFSRLYYIVIQAYFVAATPSFIHRTLLMQFVPPVCQQSFKSDFFIYSLSC